MTDKQITSKCNDKECGQCSFEEQLKRKEQECERLKEVANITRLKRINSTISRKNLKLELDQLKAENKHLNDLLNQALKDYEKAMQTLTEIKEIAEKYKNLNFGEQQYCRIDILQKISEAENETTTR